MREPVDLFDVVVVGAGMAGLVAARALVEMGCRVVVIDKARGPGGRMSTRRLGTAVFDHGAQFFTARDPRFQQFTREMIASRAARTWSEDEPPSGAPRLVGHPSMTAPAKWIATRVDVRCGCRATRLRSSGDHRIGVVLDDGAEVVGRHVILTAPLPQSLDLCRGSGLEIGSELAEAGAAVSYEPCFALMVAVEPGGSRVPQPGWLEPGESNAIRWIADNHLKGISPQPGALTIHASHTFSRVHFDTAPDRVTRMLLEAAAPWISAPVMETSLHRWRFSRPDGQHSTLCAGLPGLPVVVAGDAFGGPRVEGAALSGWAAAEFVGRSLGLQ